MRFLHSLPARACGCALLSLAFGCTDPPGINCADATRYADDDRDGFGDPARSDRRCEEPGWVDRADDCDDGDAAIHPDAQETCDGVDQNCDGVPDEGVATGGFVDADGDGHGSLTPACDPDEEADDDGVVTSSDDCDDANADIHPGAEDVAGDATDADCGGDADLSGTVEAELLTVGSFEGKDPDSGLDITAIARREGVLALLLLDGASIKAFTSWRDVGRSTTTADDSIALATRASGLAIARGWTDTDDGILALESEANQLELFVPAQNVSSTYYDFDARSGVGTACVWPEVEGWLACSEPATGDLVLVDATVSETRALKDTRDAWLSMEGPTGESMALADLDGDGAPEVISAGSGMLSIASNARLFPASEREEAVYATVEFPSDDVHVSAIDDINEDGIPDLAVTGGTRGWILSGDTQGFGKDADAVALGFYSVTEGDGRQWAAFTLPNGSRALAVGLPSEGQLGIVTVEHFFVSDGAPALTERVFDVVVQGDVGFGSSVIVGDLDPVLAGDELVVCNASHDGGRGWCGVLSPAQFQ